jgi:hypothetical protein
MEPGKFRRGTFQNKIVELLQALALLAFDGAMSDSAAEKSHIRHEAAWRRVFTRCFSTSI